MTWDDTSGTELTVQFVRRKDYQIENLSYTIETSDDLSGWTAISPTVTIISDDGSDYEVVETTFTVSPDTDPTRHFGRVNVVQHSD